VIVNFNFVNLSSAMADNNTDPVIILSRVGMTIDDRFIGYSQVVTTINCDAVKDSCNCNT
jgi:hypothetical protein